MRVNFWRNFDIRKIKEQKAVKSASDRKANAGMF